MALQRRCQLLHRRHGAARGATMAARRQATGLDREAADQCLDGGAGGRPGRRRLRGRESAGLLRAWRGRKPPGSPEIMLDPELTKRAPATASQCRRAAALSCRPANDLSRRRVGSHSEQLVLATPPAAQESCKQPSLQIERATGELRQLTDCAARWRPTKRPWSSCKL